MLNGQLFKTQLNAINWNGGQLVAVGNQGTILISRDAQHWQKIHTNFNYDLTSITWDGNDYVVMAGQRVLTSEDAIHWALDDVIFSDGVKFVGWNDTRLLAIGYNHFTSEHGNVWRLRPVRYDDNKYETHRIYGDITIAGHSFLVGNSFGIFSSPDGIKWTTELCVSNVCPILKNPQKQGET